MPAYDPQAVGFKTFVIIILFSCGVTVGVAAAEALC